MSNKFHTRVSLFQSSGFNYPTLNQPWRVRENHSGSHLWRHRTSKPFIPEKLHIVCTLVLFCKYFFRQKWEQYSIMTLREGQRNSLLVSKICYPGFFFCPFYGRNSALFSMANHIFFFPNFCPKIPNSKGQKIFSQTKVFSWIKASQKALLMPECKWNREKESQGKGSEYNLDDFIMFVTHKFQH